MKKLMVLLAFFSLALFSCKTASTGSESSLTHISMNDITQTQEVIDLMKTTNKTLNWYELTIDGAYSDCSDDIKESNEPSKITIKEKSLIMNTKYYTCVYTLDLTYGVKEGNTYTAYFRGRTDIGGKNNPYPKVGNTTKVHIDLDFVSNGYKVENIEVADATTTPASGTTFADINSNTSGYYMIRVKDLFTTDPIEKTHLKTRYLYDNTTDDRYFLLQYNKDKSLVDHIYKEILTFKKFKLEKDPPITWDFTGKDKTSKPSEEYTLTNASNLTKGEIYVFARVFVKSPNYPHISSTNDTFSIRNCEEIELYIYTFKYTGATTFKDTDLIHGAHLIFVPDTSED